jgi:glycosyltransferase involved in cell wall biosynthesis
MGYRPEQVTVIHNTVDARRFVLMGKEEREALRAELGLSPEDFVLVGAGRLVPEKGFDVILRALARFSSQVPRARLLLAGGGPGEEDLRVLQRALALGGRARFLGVRADLHRILQAGDIFIFSSLCCEGFPVVPLEAMALSVPCLASQVEPIGEMIEEGRTGYLFPPGDVEALGRALTHLAPREEERSEVARAAREAVLTRFDAREGARRLAACYRSLLRERPRP